MSNVFYGNVAFNWSEHMFTEGYFIQYFQAFGFNPT